MALAFLPAGLLSDRVGRRPMIFIAWFFGMASTLIMAVSHALAPFTIGMILYGMTGYVTVPLNAYSTAARGRWSVGRTLTMISASFSLGSILGPLLGGWVGERFGLIANFRIAAVFFVISTALILMIRPQPVETSSADSTGGRLSELFHNQRFMVFVALMFLVMFGLYMSQPLTANFLQNERAVDLGRLGVLIAARSVGVVLLNLWLGQWNARVGQLAAQAGMALFNLLIWVGGGFPVYLAGYFLMGSYITARNLAIAQGRTLVRAGNMGAAYGLMETVMGLAIVLGPPTAGYLYTLQPEWMYLVGLGLIGLGVVGNLALSPVHRQDMQLFEEKEQAEWAGS
jgi:MFS family permease